MTYDGLRTFIAECDRLGEIKRIDGAHWDVEIGALSEVTSELIPEPPALLFDRIADYPAGFRVLSLPVVSRVRTALALRLPTELPRMELVRRASRLLKSQPKIPPQEVETGPVMQNVMRGAEVDLTRFPALKSHRHDGGRYIGTGCTVSVRDMGTGYVNMGTYRLQLHEGDLLGLWQSPGQQGRQIAEQYWKEGKACPVALTFGGDPLVMMTSYTKFPWGVSELDVAGGILKTPLSVIRGPLTGLPIPAHAEIAAEGEIPPPSEEARAEGPFGEWPGYYSGGTLGTGENQPVIRIKAVYFRNDPILLNMSPQWPGAPHQGPRISSGNLWDQLESVGVPGIVGVYVHNSFLTVIAIEQKYAGHARQTAMAAMGCSAIARLNRYVVIVDEDIDPSNLQEVVWAMTSRVDPIRDIQFIDDCWSSPLDPRMPPHKKAKGPYTMSRAIYYAVRPWEWRESFPKVIRIDKADREMILEKYGSSLPFPKM